MNNKLILPRTLEDGKPYISYSQYNSWITNKSFNLGVKGWQEYIITYFLGYDFCDKGYGEFGHDVEDYICFKKGKDKFGPEEIKTLDKIKPLGTFQKYFNLDLGEFAIIGYLDDCNEDLTRIRDYKTGSVNSLKQYTKDTYKQMDVYAMYGLQETKQIPELEICAIERTGNCFKDGGRDVLKVADCEPQYIKIKTSEERIEEIKQDIIKTAYEISEHYKMFNLLN